MIRLLPLAASTLGTTPPNGNDEQGVRPEGALRARPGRRRQAVPDFGATINILRALVQRGAQRLPWNYNFKCGPRWPPLSNGTRDPTTVLVRGVQVSYHAT